MPTRQQQAIRLSLLLAILLCALLLWLLAYLLNENSPVKRMLAVVSPESQPCRKRSSDGQDSFVCVCNAAYCDQPEPVDEAELDQGRLVFFVSSRREHRLRRFVAEAEEEQQGEKAVDPTSAEADAAADADGIPPPPPTLTVRVDSTQHFQPILGFGGSFTDSAGLNWNSLSPEAKKHLLAAYFDGRAGIGYSLGRVPIGASDFSTRGYTYLDAPDDFNLSAFALAHEDLEQKIPFILAANRLISNRSLLLMGSPWTAPAWMKSNGQLQWGGQLKGNLTGPYYHTYANYFRRFLEEYAARGVPFWGVSIQNEPDLAAIERLNFIPSMAFSNLEQRDFAHELLSPLLKQTAGLGNVKILAGDDFRANSPETAQEIYSDPERADAIDGLAFHWYDFSPFQSLSEAHTVRPDKLLLASEACTGVFSGPALGNWTRGWLYGWDILNTLKHWSVGWIDWNLCLDQRGGPNWINNYVDSPIIVNAEADEFYKQPMFYFMAHFSRFIPRGSVRIGSKLVDKQGRELEDKYESNWQVFTECNQQPDSASAGADQQHVAFLTGDGERFVLVLIRQSKEEERNNKEIDEEITIRVRDEESGRSWLLPIGRDSIVTAIWKKKIPKSRNENDEEAENSRRKSSDRSNL